MNQIVLITGASSGIGAACAHLLAESGYQVYAGYRNTLPQSLIKANITPVCLDVRQTQDWQETMGLIAKDHPDKGLYALINNAGIGLGGPLVHLPIEQFQEQFEVNYFGVVRGIQYAYPQLIRGGRIISISSVSGRVVTPYLAPYCSSKYALEALMETLYYELKSEKIYCSLVLPGLIRTPIFQKASQQLNELQNHLSEDLNKHYSPIFSAFTNSLSRVQEKATEPEVVAKVVLDILTSPKPRLRYSVGKDAKIALALRKLLPDSMFQQIMMSFGIAKPRD